jgi:two-component system sensor histidine kinase YesM
MFNNIFHKNTIKRKIFFSYVLLLIIPLAIAVLFHYWKTTQILENKAEEQFDTVIRVVNQQFEQYFIDIQNLSMNIFGSSIIQEYLKQPYLPPTEWTTAEVRKEAEIKQFLNGIYNLKPGISSIMIYGYNDIHQFYHPTRRWDYTFNGMEEDWFIRTEEMDGHWVLSGRREERQFFDTLEPTPEEVVTFSRLIKDVDTFEPLGVLAINIKLELIEKLATLPHSSSQLLILDNKEIPVVASANFDPSFDASDVIEVSLTSPFLNWKTVYIASKSQLIKESKQIRNFMLVITIGLLIIALVFAHVISSGIVKPLSKLREKMKDVEKGQFQVNVRPTQSDEVGELTLRFNHMVKRIKHLVEEIRHKEKQKTEVELSAMQARINPHFMYNTLNGIRWVAMMEGSQKLAKMIESFVFLLKFSAKNKDRLITVDNEVRLLQHYVELMRMRNDQFNFHMHIEDGMDEHLIISFLLQPIVENSIFHGIVPMKTRGKINVELYTEGNQNLAVIRDNGVGMEQHTLDALLSSEPDREQSTNFNRIGLKNVYERLKLQFGERAQLTVSSHRNKGTEVRIQWPILTGVEDDDKYSSC